jgi:hypothetical protein
MGASDQLIDTKNELIQFLNGTEGKKTDGGYYVLEPFFTEPGPS